MKCRIFEEQAKNCPPYFFMNVNSHKSNHLALPYSWQIIKYFEVRIYLVKSSKESTEIKAVEMTRRNNVSNKVEVYILLCFVRTRCYVEQDRF